MNDSKIAEREITIIVSPDAQVKLDQAISEKGNLHVKVATRRIVYLINEARDLSLIGRRSKKEAFDGKRGYNIPYKSFTFVVWLDIVDKENATVLIGDVMIDGSGY